MNDDAATPEGSRPNALMRALAWLGVLLLTISLLLPFAGFVAIVIFAVGLGTVPITSRHVGSEGVALVLAILVVGAIHLLFVAAAGALRFVLNRFGKKKVSPFRWAAVAWILTVYSEAIVGGGLSEAGGTRLGFVLWFSTGCALFSLWLAVLLAQALWQWSSRSVTGAKTVAIAATVLVVLPVGSIVAVARSRYGTAGESAIARLTLGNDARGSPVGQGPTANQLTATEATPTAATEATPRAASEATSMSATEADSVSALGYARDSSSPYAFCLEQLQGGDCRSVWARAVETFGNGDEVQQAFFYSCIERELRAPRLCSTFMSKVRGLRVDAYRYSRKFKDRPDVEAPRCPVPTAEEAIMSQEELDNLDHAKALLDERERGILDLAYRQGLTDKEIGHKLLLSEVRVRVLRRDAERALKRNLESCR